MELVTDVDFSSLKLRCEAFHSRIGGIDYTAEQHIVVCGNEKGACGIRIFHHLKLDGLLRKCYDRLRIFKFASGKLPDALVHEITRFMVKLYLQKYTLFDNYIRFSPLSQDKGG
jgi:hypothetical protein